MRDSFVCYLLLFSSVPFNIFYLYLVFVSLINMCVSVCSFLGLSFMGLSAFQTWLGYFPFPILGKFFDYNLFKYFLTSFSLFSLSSGTTIIRMLVHFMLFGISETVLILFFIYFLIYFMAGISPFCLPGPYPILLPQV